MLRKGRGGGGGPEKRKMEEDLMDPSTSAGLNLKLLKVQLDCDVFFMVGPQREKVGAHKAILRERSGYFKASLSERWDSRSDANEIELENEEPSIFRLFLEHIYTYGLNATSPVEAVKLLHMAQYYEVPSLAKPCEKILAEPFQPQDLLEIFVSAQRFLLKNVIIKAGGAMANSFVQLANSAAFEKVDETTLIYLMEREDLIVEELELFSILYRWASKQIENSTKEPKPEYPSVLKNLLNYVRFPTMKPEEYAQVVAPKHVLPLKTERNLLLYFIQTNEDERDELARNFPFSTDPRKNGVVSIDLYAAKSRPGSGTYPFMALIKRANVQDLLTFKIFGPRTTMEAKVVSLVLEPPKYSEPLFRNSSQVAAMNFPIRVAITCFEANSSSRRPKWMSEEITATIGTKKMLLTLEEPWILSVGKRYKISVRFLSEVYTVPDAVVDGNGGQATLRDTDFDFFTATAFRSMQVIPVHVKQLFVVLTESISGGSGSLAGASTRLAATSLSSGLHVIRSIQFKDV